jgi:DNA-binding beta-propeller fold protein YncE
MPETGAAGDPRGIIAIDKVANRIRFYDPFSLEETKVIEGPEQCVHELAVAPDRRTAYVPLYGDGIYGNNKSPNNKVLAVDLALRDVAAIIDLGGHVAPHGMAAMSDGRLWVVCDLPGMLLSIDPARAAVEDVFQCPGKGPHLVVAAPDEAKLYVSHKEGAIGVFDIAARRFVSEIAIGDPGVKSGNGSGGEGLALTPGAAWLVAIDNATNDLRVIDTDSDREIDRVPLAEHPPTNPKRSRLAKPLFSPDGRYLVVTSYATALAWIIDGGDLRRQTVVPVAKGPMGVLFSVDGRSVIVSSHDSGLLTRIDLVSGKIIEAKDGGAGIEVLAYF